MKLLKALIKLKISLLFALGLAFAMLATPIAFNKLFRSYIGAAVFIVKDITQSRGSGTGFIVSNSKGKKFFITNNHVCKGLQSDGRLLVSSNYASSGQLVLNIIKTFPAEDICVVEAPESGRALFLSTSFSAGDVVHIFGHPIGYPLHKTSGELIGPITIQIVEGTSIFDLKIKEMSGWQTSAPTSPGNSGSPAVDNLGRVVGVLFAGSTVNSYTSFIIPSTVLSKIIESL